ncbi:MAG: glycine--tRNA ligase subunit beta [Devosiaceae bacterium]|nr:glycine--tRNA ligase subunit beta [Devosiaceae bacterium]
MPELLFEIFCEEIPARLQRAAAQNLKKAVTGALIESGLTYGSAAAFVTPRRLVVSVGDIPSSSPDKKEERKGPKTSAPEQAIAGFLRGAGLNSIDEAQIKTDPKKGDFYVAITEKKGELATKILARILPEIIHGFSWGKPMKWGAGNTSWVRPIRSILASFGTANEDPELIEFEIGDIKSSQTSFGHRFMAPAPFVAKRFDDYAQELENAKVVLDQDRRIEIIKTDAQNLAFAQGLELVADPGLLEEVSGLVEWPVVMMGNFPEEFLQLPQETIIGTIKNHQKCFCLRDNSTGRLTNKFIMVANIKASDGGKVIVGGNERVIGARLSDAMFFYQNDLATPLVDLVEKLDKVVFHKKLGTQRQRVERLVTMAQDIAIKIGADVNDTIRAALLAKSDLLTQMVNEFPELQGLMGSYYALAQGEKPQIADAIKNHYKPVGPSDIVPDHPVSIALAMADKLDILSSFWAINEKPTGSRDPFALRRAALGVIRLLLENNISFKLQVEPDLLKFFHDRLKVSLRDQGAAHGLVDAVIDKNSSDLLEISNRVNALSALLKTPDGQSLLAGYRRGTNILGAEEKKGKAIFSGEVEKSLLSKEEELELAEAIETTGEKTAVLINENQYGEAVLALASLRAPIDAFFEHVMVNDEDKNIRQNRLNLLAKLRNTMHLVADFSKISG